jgi:hypothetical protein
MSDRTEFMLKYGRPNDVREILNNPTKHGIENADWALHLAMKNPAAPQDVVDRAFSRGTYTTQELAAQHPNLSTDLHAKALKHDAEHMRKAALLNPQTTRDDLHKVRDEDPDHEVKNLADHLLAL